jgi:hypothetical protein
VRNYCGYVDPLPASPIKGEGQISVWGTIVPNEPAGTSPFMGEAGRGPV